MSEGKQKKSSSSFRWVRRRKSRHAVTRQGSEDRKISKHGTECLLTNWMENPCSFSKTRTI
ncbi:MAG TPA: hypothetical protein PLO13_01990 [Anaerolineaceae bacterium]|nr:hypothetical protein [Anaerolineaceae bacterium]